MGTNSVTYWAKDLLRRWPDELEQALIATCQRRAHAKALQPQGPIKNLELGTQTVYTVPTISHKGGSWTRLDVNPVIGCAVAVRHEEHPGLDIDYRAQWKRWLAKQGFRHQKREDLWLPPSSVCTSCESYLDCVLKDSRVVP